MQKVRKECCNKIFSAGCPLDSAQWSWIGAYGGWGDSRLKEFDNNHQTKNQVFI